MRAKCEKMRVKEKIFSKNFCFLNFLPYLCGVIQRNPLRHTCTSLRRLLNGRSTITLSDT